MEREREEEGEKEREPGARNAWGKRKEKEKNEFHRVDYILHEETNRMTRGEARKRGRKPFKLSLAWPPVT